MRILCVCDYGVNRSQHIAHVLKFRGSHDTLPVGLLTASPETVDMLAGWADLVIVTDEAHRARFPGSRVWVWPLVDGAKRPFNQFQHRLVGRYVDEHRDRLIELDASLA